ncbi:MAG TPA: alpha/beta hydrolase [Polyangiales bacterium]|nr:alpha/beta hydrolase [Polyangiales bacterium]
MEARDVQVDGCRVRYVEAGRGEPVLLLHGYPQNHRCWRHQIPALAASYRVIAPDWFGFGASERRLDVAPTYELESERIGKFAQAVGAPRFNLIAHDYGGYLGLGYTQRRPETVLRLALLNSRAHRDFSPRFHRYSKRQHWVARHAITRALASHAPLHAMHRRGLERYVRRGCFSDALRKDYVAWLDTPEGRRFFFHFFEFYQVDAPPALAANLARIRCPTAIIYGDRDAYVPFDTARELAAGIPSATLTRLEGVSHYSMEERPEAVTLALQELLARAT